MTKNTNTYIKCTPTEWYNSTGETQPPNTTLQYENENGGTHYIQITHDN